MQCLAVAAAAPALRASSHAENAKLGRLRPDPNQILDLAEGFSYRIVSRAGDVMSDGLRVPYAHDGMAAFAGDDGRVVLVCNHELAPGDARMSAFGESPDSLLQECLSNFYDAGGGSTPGTGGTTTTIYNPRTGNSERQHLSLAGTELNCAGGATPWGSWLSCEECFELPGIAWSAGRRIEREKAHGYVFEVSAYNDGLVAANPIKAMGRFEHEAAAVHTRSSIVYMTEDRQHSLFYRYIPNVPGKLHEGGRLQALAIEDQSSPTTHNWSRAPDIQLGESLRTRWNDLSNVDSDEHDLRLRGAVRGATTFARGEGLCISGDELYFTCTIGGRARLGQVFAYRTSPYEGSAKEQDAPGELSLVAEATSDSLLRNADNLTVAPWGDLLICEDTGPHCGIVGIGPDGQQYALADNAHTGSELAGICFSPDGKTLFVNIQYPGMTLAITGPWPA